MATTAQLDLSIWRNDDVYEYPLRVIGPNLDGIGMKAQIRLERDTPGVALVALELVTNANAEGIRLASTTLIDGRWVNDVRIRINKTTRIALPYAGEIGDAAVLRWAMAIDGRTRIDGRVVVLAHTLDSNGAPADRPEGFGRSIQQSSAPASGASLTINEDDGASLVIDGADMLGGIAAQTSADAASASASAALVDRALPAVAGTVVSARMALLAREPVATDFLAGAFAALTVTARGAELAGGAGGFETWISTRDPAASFLTFALYSRPSANAANDGAGHAGDVLHLTETRRLDQLAGTFLRDGTPNRIVVDFLSRFDPDPARLYLLAITMGAGAGPTTFAFLQAKGVSANDPAYPQANGYFRETAASNWASFAADSTAAFRWMSAERPGAAAMSADVLSLGKQTRTITVGAPEGIVSNTNGAAALGVWWNEWPLVQGGLVTRLYLTATRAGYVTVHMGERLADGSIVQRRSVSVYATGAGSFSYDAGDLFEPFAAEAGWLIGIEQALAIVAYSVVGNSWKQEGTGAASYMRGSTLAIGAEVLVSALPVAPIETKRRRTQIWRETLDSDVAPRGFDQAGAIVYSAAGMTLTNGTAPGWATRVYTHRYVRTDQRVTRVWFDVKAAGTRLAIVTGKPAAAQFLDAGNSNSAVEIDGAANKLRIKASGIGDGSAGDPGDIVSVDLGFAITSGHSYLLEWSLAGTVHSAVLIDLTTSAQSPLLVSGDPVFAGVDTVEGFQNGSLGFAFVAGKASITAVEVLHDGASPQTYIEGDSIAKQVYVPANESWAGQLAADGVAILRSAQPGGTSLGSLWSAWLEVVAARPRTVIIAVGVNDVLLNVPVADTRWNVRSAIDIARRVGARIVLVMLHPIPGRSVAAYNAMIADLNAGQSDIDVWRWDKALTVNGDGVTPNTALLRPDGYHPSASGAAAQFRRLLGDGPAIFD